MSVQEADTTTSPAERLGWLDRRHEWLLMYRMGMEPTAIARRCRTTGPRVQAYLDEQMGRDPLLWHRRLLVHTEPSPPRHTPGTTGAEWELWHRMLLDFTEKHGRLPRHTSGATIAGALELALHGWAREQRAALTRHDRLTGDQRLLVKAVPGLTRSGPREKLADQWRDKLNRTRDFITREGRWPSQSKPHTDEEQILGRWTNAQRRKAHDGHLPTTDLELLNRTLPGWQDYLDQTARRPA